MVKTTFTAVLVLAITISAYSQEKLGPQPAFDFLINYPNVRDFTMTADGKEAYFTIQNPLEELAIIVSMTKNENKWSDPVIVSFSGNFRDIEPSLSPDGLRLYFSSDRPLKSSSVESKDYDIWYVERKDVKSDWSAPVNLGAPVNSDKDEFYPSLSRNGNIYFTSERETGAGKDDIFISTWNETYKTFTPSTPLGKSINTPGLEFNACIDPDEKYIIYTGYARPEGVGSGDLYISYKDLEGNWGASKSLGTSINSKYMDYCPFVDLKTGTLYFTSRRSDISVHNFTSLKEFEKVTQQYENGFSRLYKVSIAGLLK